MNHVAPQRGFTLLELIVAVAIFAMMSAMAFGGLTSVLSTAGVSDVQQARLAEVQLALARLERDMEQMVDRSANGPLGDVQPGLSASTTGLEFTRAGRANPLHRERSRLVRVSLEVDRDGLRRIAWPVVDRPAGAQPPEPELLLSGVEEARVRFLNESDTWVTEWPPLRENGEPAEGLPRAAEITLVLGDWGEIRRLLVLPGGG